MVELPSQTPTIDAIYSMYEERERATERRTYLGCSQIGEECRRSLWLSFRWAARRVFSGRTLRIFETGHREEARMINNLRAIGIRVEDRQADGTQYEITECDGHMKGHIDGALLGLLEAPKTWHLLENKTMARKYFNAMIKAGSIAESNPEYYDQAQFYAAAEGMTRIAFMIHCKDDDRLHIERAKVSRTRYNGLLAKANAIINADSPPDRAYKSSSFFKCKFCDFAKVCWQPVFPDVNCRTCVHSSPVADGRWTCARDFSMDGDCCEHVYIPGLLHWETPVTGEYDWIEYGDFVNATATSFGGADCGKAMKTSMELYDTTLDGVRHEEMG